MCRRPHPIALVPVKTVRMSIMSVASPNTRLLSIDQHRQVIADFALVSHNPGQRSAFRRGRCLSDALIAALRTGEKATLTLQLPELGVGGSLERAATTSFSNGRT
jgi:hypothetical protein